MHIVADGFEVAIPAFHQQGFIPAAKDMAKEFVPVVQPDGVGAEQPAQARHQIGVRGFHDQMKVIIHEAISMHLPAGFLTRLRQGFEKVLPVNVVQENGLPPIPATHDMIEGTGKLDS